MTSIGTAAFKGCSSLTNITIPNSVTSIGDESFKQCSNLTSITIPNGVTSIGYQTFLECYKLTTLAIPETVNIIGKYALDHCTGLKDFICKAETVPQTDIEAFKNCNLSNVTLHVPSSGLEEYQSTSPWNEFGNIVAIKHIFSLIYIVDGVVYKSYEVAEGTSIIPEVYPTKEGYTFSGWSEIPTTMPSHDVTVTGTFTINSYTLTYLVDGKEYKTSTVEFGTALTPEAEPAKEGYTFSGWSEIPETMPNHDVTVTGTFTVNSYTLTYLVDGETYKTTTVEYGTALTAEENPVKEGYTFSGWSGLPATMPAKDVTVTGSFTINSYTLTYWVDGKEYKTSTVEYGTALTPEAEPTKEGYTFSGWSQIPETMPAHDVMVTGSFSINSYTIIYMVDGEEYKRSSVNYGTTLTPETEPEREGYTFSGWSEIPATMPAEDVTVTGTFTINSYKLTYLVDGVEYKSFVIKYGEVITPETEPQKEGYSFSGWSEVPGTMPAHDVTVTGSFSKGQYQVTYMVDGEVYKTVRYDYEAAVTAEEAPEKEGYTFSGWSEVPTTMPAHDVTVTGTFSVNSYTLLYMVDGEEYKTASVEYGTELTAEENPEKEGYSFSGWSEVPATMPAHDVTVTGTFVINQYSITYMYEGEVFQTVTLDYQAEVEAPAFPLVVEGYTFVWEGLPKRMPAHDVTVVGVFQVNQYCITYVVDGEVVDTQMVDYGSEITPPEMADREGYTFEWAPYPQTMPARDLTITGSYLTGISSLKGGLAVQQIYTVDGKRVNRVGRGVHLVRQGKQIIKIVK